MSIDRKYDDHCYMEAVARIAEQDALIKDLVEALEGWQQLFRGYHPDDSVLKALRDITSERIAKATKESAGIRQQ